MINSEVRSLADSIELLPDSVIIVDAAHRIVECNSHALAFFGYTRAELIGSDLNILLPDNLRSRHADHARGFFRNGSARQMGKDLRLWARHKSGKQLAVDIALAPYEYESGKQVVAVIRDVEHQRRMEREVIRKNKHLERINSDLEKFACVVSHDLKSPLNSLQDTINLLLLELSDEKRADVSDLTAEVKQRMRAMQTLINGILEYSRRGLDSDFIEAVNLQDLIEDVRGIIHVPENFHIELPRMLPTIMANRTKLLQVILNLVSNAIKYNTKSRGMLRITYEDAPGEFTFHVADNGSPVPENERARMFDLFANGGTHGKGESSHGVGLATVRTIVEEYGGNVWYSDSELGGTCVNFSIRKTRSAMPGAAAHSPRNATALPVGAKTGAHPLQEYAEQHGVTGHRCLTC